MSGRRFLPKRHIVENRLAQQVKIVIVCEGKKTEPEYFGAYVARHFREPRNIRIIPNAMSKTGVEQLYDIATTSKAKYPNAVVFIVLDNDNKLANRTEKRQLCTVLSKCSSLDKVEPNKVNCVFSNPQFELWAVLHFEYTTAVLNKREIERKTRRYFPEYDPKTNKAIDYDVIVNSPESEKCAIKNAKKLRMYHLRLKQKCFLDCPTTNVDVLVEYMNRVCVHRPC